MACFRAIWKLEIPHKKGKIDTMLAEAPQLALSVSLMNSWRMEDLSASLKKYHWEPISRNAGRVYSQLCGIMEFHSQRDLCQLRRAAGAIKYPASFEGARSHSRPWDALQHEMLSRMSHARDVLKARSIRHDDPGYTMERCPTEYVFRISEREFTGERSQPLLTLIDNAFGIQDSGMSSPDPRRRAYTRFSKALTYCMISQALDERIDRSFRVAAEQNPPLVITCSRWKHCPWMTQRAGREMAL